jgi:hypothetical protein
MEVVLKALSHLSLTLLWQYPLSLIAAWSAGWLYDSLFKIINRLLFTAAGQTNASSVEQPSPLPVASEGDAPESTTQNLPRFLLTMLWIVLNTTARNLCRGLGCYFFLVWVAHVDESYLIVLIGPSLFSMFMGGVWTGACFLLGGPLGIMVSLCLGIVALLVHQGIGFILSLGVLLLALFGAYFHNLLSAPIKLLSMPLGCYLLLERLGYENAASTVYWYFILHAVNFLVFLLLSVSKAFVNNRVPRSSTAALVLGKIFIFIESFGSTQLFATGVLARFLALAGALSS